MSYAGKIVRFQGEALVYLHNLDGAQEWIKSALVLAEPSGNVPSDSMRLLVLTASGKQGSVYLRGGKCLVGGSKAEFE